MDLAFQAEYNEQRSARVIGRAWTVRTRGATILSWCMGIAGLIWLFGREVHGPATNCPYVVESSWPSRLVSSFLKTSEPDECLYIFDDEEEEDKVGLFARFGERSYEAYFPCGCACEQLSGSFDHIKELHKPTVFFESEKEKWLEKVRPIAKDLYESEDE